MNRDLFWSSIESEHERATAFCRRLSGSRDEGDDFYQEAVLKAFLNRETLRDTNAFRSWLYRIIVNLYKNRRREPLWRRFVPLTPELEEATPGWDPTGSNEARRRIEQAFAAVTPEERTLVTLFDLEGWPIAELAQLYQKPEGTIKARLSRARAKMRRHLMKRLAHRRHETTTNNKLHEAGICVATKLESE
jgi:RNA polymerase sigma-70 factor (ECF subfamily)